jgi:CheY-like chemotaxis protein
MTVETVECRLVEVLADVEPLMRSRAAAKGIGYTVEYQTPIPEQVRTDPTRFRQILMNLVGNAIKFTDKGSVRVLVHMREDFTLAMPGHRAIVEVVDTGVGISAQQQRLLFQPFTQADVSTTRRFGGTGLGLSISRRLAVMLGGDLTVRSELGKGSTFRLSLPMEAVEGAGTLRPSEAHALASGRRGEMEDAPHLTGLRVLLAEDGPENREVITLHLHHAGCETTAAEDGRQAYEIALAAKRNGDPFDVILMDMQMPVMDGYTATSKLRADGYSGTIIALTAHAMKEDRERCLRAGCDEYATKPVNMPALLQMMARCGGRRGGPAAGGQMPDHPALRRLTRKFCEGFPATLAALRELAGRGAWEDVAAGAHRLAGAGGAYGFEEITRRSKALERAARGGHGGEATEALMLLEQACRKAQLRVAQAGASAEGSQVIGETAKA